MTQIVVRLPYEEKAQFMKIATKNDMTMSQLIRWLIRWLIRCVNDGASTGIHMEIKD